MKISDFKIGQKAFVYQASGIPNTYDGGFRKYDTRVSKIYRDGSISLEDFSLPTFFIDHRRKDYLLTPPVGGTGMRLFPTVREAEEYFERERFKKWFEEEGFLDDMFLSWRIEEMRAFKSFMEGENAT